METPRKMTPAEIIALPDEARTQLFRDLATRRYGERKTLDLCAEEMGYARRAVFNWVSENNVPLPVLFALSAWEHSATVAATLIHLYERP